MRTIISTQMKQKWKRTNGSDGCRGARGKIAQVHYCRSSEGDKRRPGNLPIVGYRHPEVALIEIMIGGLMRPRRIRGEKTERQIGKEGAIWNCVE